MAKGGAYEREVCKQLSLWASGGKCDNWYWRTSNSGGWATVRAKKGKETNHDDDICATDPRGQFLLDYFAIEIKRGYNKTANPIDLLCRKSWPKGKARKSTFVGFLEQVQAIQKRKKRPSWLLIHRLDGKAAMAYLPMKDLVWMVMPSPQDWIGLYVGTQNVAGIRFEDLLLAVAPVSVRLTLKQWKEDK